MELNRLQGHSIRDSIDLVGRRIYKYPHCWRDVSRDPACQFQRYTPWAAGEKVETDDVGTRIDGSSRVDERRNTTNLDSKHN